MVAGSVRITREERSEGPVIRVFVDGGVQALKFDCFDRGAHFHLDPDGRNRVLPINDSHPRDWTARALPGRLREMLQSAGYGDANVELAEANIQLGSLSL